MQDAVSDNDKKRRKTANSVLRLPIPTLLDTSHSFLPVLGVRGTLTTSADMSHNCAARCGS